MLLDFVILKCIAIRVTAQRNGKMYLVPGSSLLHSATVLSMVLSKETSTIVSVILPKFNVCVTVHH